MVQTMRWRHPTGRTPESVTLVALGPTKRDFFDMQTAHEPEIMADETWTLNTGIRWCRADLCFVMDDLRWYAERYSRYGKDLRETSIPIITSALHDGFPTAMLYPLNEVVDAFGTENAYFHNSVPYVLAYALFIGVKRINLFGADYTHPSTVAREPGRANCEYWVGFCRARGMTVIVPSTTTLLDACEGPSFYGYLHQPIVSATPAMPGSESHGGAVATLPRDALPGTLPDDTASQWAKLAKDAREANPRQKMAAEATAAEEAGQFRTFQSGK